MTNCGFTDWIKKECPYFEILDEVMTTRPNLNPWFMTHSSGDGTIGEESSSDVIQIEDDNEDSSTAFDFERDEDLNAV